MTTITAAADPACCLADTVSNVCTRGDKLSCPLVDCDINKIVERKLCSNNFRVLHWSLDPLAETNGYLGNYYNLSVTVKVNDKSKSLKFFAKTPPPSDSPQYEFLMRFNTFNKEIIIYLEIFASVGKGNGPKWMPDCYLGKNNLIIVLEDANQEGYVMPDKYVPFDEDHCISMVRALSIFHSRSLILQENLRRNSKRTILDLYGHLLNEVLFVADDQSSQKALASSLKGVYAAVDLAKELKNEEERIMVKKRIARWTEKMTVLLGPSSKYRNVMCHRDVWANNFMFKRDYTGKPIGCYIIDFQFLRYCPPAFDFIFSLYLTTNHDIREHFYDSLLAIYYDTMRQELATEGLDVENHLPRKEFIKSCAEAKHIALIYAVLNLQIMLLTSDTVNKYFQGSSEKLVEILYGNGRADVVRSQCQDRPEYKTRMLEVIYEIRDCLPDYPPNL